MEKYKKYLGILIFVGILTVVVYAGYALISPKYVALEDLQANIEKQTTVLDKKRQEVTNVQNKIKKIKDSIMTAQKKIYSPVESSLGNDTLFFTLYSDLLEMVHANSIKIKSIDYAYSPESDEFVKFGKDVYFVCDINMELVSNYVNLGKLIQDVYQYPYYIRINSLDVKPYEKDKTVLLSNLSLRLYAHTEPAQEDSPLPGVDAPMPKLGN